MTTEALVSPTNSSFPRRSPLNALVRQNVATHWISCPESLRINPWDRAVLDLEVGRNTLEAYIKGGRVGTCMPRGSVLRATRVPSRDGESSVSIEIWNPTDDIQILESGTFIAFVAPF